MDSMMKVHSSHSSGNQELVLECVDGKHLVPVLRRYDLHTMRAMINDMNRPNKTKDFSNNNDSKEVDHGKCHENNTVIKECEYSKKGRSKRRNTFVKNSKNNYNLRSRKKYNFVREETNQMKKYSVKQNKTLVNKNSQVTNMNVLDMPILDGSSEVTYKPHDLNYAPKGLSEEFCDILKRIKQMKNHKRLDLNSKPNNVSRCLNKRVHRKRNCKQPEGEHINGTPHSETSSSKCKAHRGVKPKFHLKPGKRPYVLSGGGSIVKVGRFKASRMKSISLPDTVTLRSPIKTYNSDISSNKEQSHRVKLLKKSSGLVSSKTKTESSYGNISVQYKLNSQSHSFDIELDNSNCGKYSLESSTSFMTEMFPVQYLHENEELANILLAQADGIVSHGSVCQLKILQKYKEESDLQSSRKCESLKGSTFRGPEGYNCGQNMLMDKRFS